MSEPWSQTKQRAAIPDYCDPAHAGKLVERIKAYRAAKNLKPLVVAEHPAFGETLGRPRRDIRSNMVNGWPEGSHDENA